MNNNSLNSGVAMDVGLCRKERHKLLRKSDIIRAAEHVFALKGFHKATIQDIARQAQYATGTVYLYFKDKDALYFSIVEDKLKDFLHILGPKISQSKKGPREKLEVFIYESLRFAKTNQDFFRVFVQETTRWSTKSKLDKSAIVQKRKEFLIELIEEAQSEGVIRDDVEAKQVVDILESIIVSFVLSWLQGKPQGDVDIEAVSGVIADLFFNGVKKK